MRIRLAHGAFVAALMLAGSLVQAQTGRPTWNELTPAQREALAPLSKDWETLDAERKRKWIEVAAKYPNLSPDGKQRLHERMGEFSKLTPTKTTARENSGGPTRFRPSSAKHGPEVSGTAPGQEARARRQGSDKDRDATSPGT